MPITITEALAEIKTIGKRIAKKREFVTQYLARQDMIRDPLEKDGGSVEVIRKEQQSISDLETRLISIRKAIANANATTNLAINGTTRSIADWLTWRREVAPERVKFLGGLRDRVASIRKDVQQKGLNIVSATASVGGSTENRLDVLVNISEADLAKEIEDMETITGALDGQLSLKNATTSIDV